MAKHVKNNNQNTQWEIDASGDTWIIGKDAKFTVANDYAIVEFGAYDDSRIRILGDIEVTGAGYSGVNFVGEHSSVYVGASAFIDATGANSGVHSNSAGGAVTVDGVIHSGAAAVYGSKWGVVEINGLLKGGHGVQFGGAGSTIENNGIIRAQGTGIMTPGDGTRVVNSATGEIRAVDDGVAFYGPGSGEIVNRGLIKGGVHSILDGDGALTLVNRGTLRGDVALGGGNDVFDNAGGTVIGTVFGGSGNDLYKLGASQATITELFASGYDIVSSTIDRVLAGQIEELRLVGKGDIDGTGNAGNNWLLGNSGDNRLRGLDGDDRLDGGAGDDLLRGGAGADIFVFNIGDGRDTIADFADGDDFLVTEFVGSLADFNDLVANHLVENGDDLIITYGEDRLVLRNMDKTELTFSDFLIS